jgi:Delta6-protoilludene synthase
METFDAYTEAVAQEAEDRNNLVFRNVETYMQLRRVTIGAKPSFALLEHDMELPDEVFNHPLIQDLRLWSTDMICLANASRG